VVSAPRGLAPLLEPSEITQQSLHLGKLIALIYRPGRLLYLSSGLHRGGERSLGDLLGEAALGCGQSLRRKQAARRRVGFRAGATLAASLEQRRRSRLGPCENGRPRRSGRPSHRAEDKAWLAVSDEPAALVRGRYWHHLRQEQPAGEAADPEFQDQLIAKLGELTGVALPDA
jgi:hypothetical protein